MERERKRQIKIVFLFVYFKTQLCQKREIERDRTGQDRERQDRAGQDRTERDRERQDRAGQREIERDRTEQEKITSLPL